MIEPPRFPLKRMSIGGAIAAPLVIVASGLGPAGFTTSQAAVLTMTMQLVAGLAHVWTRQRSAPSETRGRFATSGAALGLFIYVALTRFLTVEPPFEQQRYPLGWVKTELGERFTRASLRA